jgi:hypothetical protein
MSRHVLRELEHHRYILWRDVAEREDGTVITDDIIISMGEHGVLQLHPSHDRKETLEVIPSNDRMKKLAEHNLAEMERALEEQGKWKQRLRHSPLGKSQQDFVAYYTDVIGIFTVWCTEHGIQLPQS